MARPVDVDALVLSNHRLSETYNVVELAAPQIGAATSPGQFVMVKRALGREPLLRRPFSVFEVLRDDRSRVIGVSLLSKQVGTVTRDLYVLEIGDHLRCLGPLGRAFSVVDPPTAAWMIAGGVGLATLAEELRARGTETTLFYGGRSAADIYRVPFFERLGVHVVVTTEDGSRGEQGRVTGPVERALEKVAETGVMIYACGPTPMMRAVAALGERSGRRTEVSLEPVMGCGLGGCYSCVVPIGGNGVASPPRFVRSCVEGPVFAGSEVAWPDLT